MSATDNARLVEGLSGLLDRDGKGPSVTRSVLKTLCHDPNLALVRHWKQDWTEEPFEVDVPIAASPRAPIAAASVLVPPLNGNTNGDSARPVNGQVLRRVLAPLNAFALRR